MLKAEKLSKGYKTKMVLKEVSFEIREKEIVSIEGASGVGKSTISRILCGSVVPDSGTVEFNGEPLFLQNKYKPGLHRKIQLIPQQAYANLDPRQKIGDAIAEPILFHKLAKSKREAAELVLELMAQVQLSSELYSRRPAQLSGGQAQRVLIARALGLSPRLLIADEATSMLDMTSQAQIIHIFEQLVKTQGLSILLISHDRCLVEAVSHRIYRLSDGELTEIKKY